LKPKAGTSDIIHPPANAGGNVDLLASSKKTKKAEAKKTRARRNSSQMTAPTLEAGWSVGFVVLFTLLFLLVIAMKLVMEYNAARADVVYSRVLATTHYAEQVRGRVQEVTARLETASQTVSVSRTATHANVKNVLGILIANESIQKIARITPSNNQIQAEGVIDEVILRDVSEKMISKMTFSGVVKDNAGISHVLTAVRSNTSSSSPILIALVSPTWLQGISGRGQINLLGDKDGRQIGANSVKSAHAIAEQFGVSPNEVDYHVRTRLLGGLEGTGAEGQRLAVGIDTLFNGELVVYQAGGLMINHAAWMQTLVFFILMTIAPLLVASILVVILLKQMDGLRTTRQALSDSDSRFRLAIEGARSGVFDWDLHSDQVLVTDSLARMFGQKKGATISAAEFLSLVHIEDREPLHTAMRGAPSSGEIDIEFRAANLPIWFQARGRPWQGQDERNTGRVVGVAIDITEQKGAQSRLNAAETRLRAALESMSESFVVWDARRRLIMCNHKFSDFFGIAPEYLRTGISYEELETMAARAIKAVHEGRDPSAVEMELTDGRWIHLSERNTAEGGLVGIGTDITAIKSQETLLVKNEKELLASVENLEASQKRISELANSYHLEKIRAEEANRSKSEFLANMSHELRTPLNAVNGFSEIMQKEMFGPLGDPRYLEYAGDILSSGQHLLNLINDILDMSKIESGKMTLSTEIIYCDELVDQCLRLVRGRAVESNLQLNSETDDVPDIEADPRAIKQVLLNILSNAIKFTPEGGRVNIVTKSDIRTGGIIFEVTDTGIGISKEDLPKLCTPFSQIESQHSKSHKGSGLGLALTKSLVDLHGGEFVIESETGIGTTVTVRLPLAPPTSALQDPALDAVDAA